MERQTMRVMAGFELNEAYVVCRTEIGLPGPPGSTPESLARLIFGQQYNIWKSQQQGRRGDKTECGEKFFSRLIPFLVEVLVQDGIYLILDFPNHPMSALLKVRQFLVFHYSAQNDVLTG